jgi:hypothetical protein
MTATVTRATAQAVPRRLHTASDRDTADKASIAAIQRDTGLDHETARLLHLH